LLISSVVFLIATITFSILTIFYPITMKNVFLKEVMTNTFPTQSYLSGHERNLVTFKSSIKKNYQYSARFYSLAAFNIAHRRAPIRVNPAFLRDSPNGPMARPRPLYWDFSRWRMVEPPRRGILGFPALKCGEEVNLYPYRVTAVGDVYHVDYLYDFDQIRSFDKTFYAYQNWQSDTLKVRNENTK